MNKKVLLFTIIMLVKLAGYSQDVIIASYKPVKALYNPSYVGYAKQLGIYSVSRITSFNKVEGSVFNSLLVDFGFNKNKMGLGFKLNNFSEVNGQINTSGGSILFAKHLRYNQNIFINLGMSWGVIYRKYNDLNLTFSDQLDPVLGVVNASAAPDYKPYLDTEIPDLVLDFASGFSIIYFAKNGSTHYFDVAAQHINSKYVDLLENSLNYYPLFLNIRYFYTNKISRFFSISPGINFSYQNKAYKVYLGTDIIYRENFGMGFSLKSGKEPLKSLNFFVVNVFYSLKNFSFLLNFEQSITRQPYIGNVIELSLTYSIKNKRKRCTVY